MRARSGLSVPGGNDWMIVRAFASHADVVVLDLEETTVIGTEAIDPANVGSHNQP